MLELGGAQRNTLDTVAGLDRSRFTVALACADRGELLPEARAMTGVALYPLRSLRREIRPLADAAAVAALRRVIRDFAPDLVHTHSSKAGIVGRLAARLERTPAVVHSIHGWGFGPHQPRAVRAAFVAAERTAARWTNAFVAVSAANLEEGVALGLFPPERARVIRSGIDLAAFTNPRGGEALRRELGVGAAPLVVQVACFKPQKAPERFLDLAASLAPRFPDARFVLVGDGAMRGELERRRAALGLEGRVLLPGWRHDLPAIYDAATVVTLTSRFEGLPRVLVEALAARRPVAAMRVDGVPEVVQDGVNGVLVPPGDLAGLAEVVAQMLADEGYRGKLAAAPREALAEWDRDRMVRQQEELYEELACQTGSS
jgi:glycosyltransferase involved in cell wall biosynthesis